jgi:hypothetical protein
MDIYALKVKRWRQRANSREAQASVINEAKVLSKLYSQRVSKYNVPPAWFLDDQLEILHGYSLLISTFLFYRSGQTINIGHICKVHNPKCIYIQNLN